MVSLWPWKSDESPTASFEKTLSALATKISKTTVAQQKLAAQSRRFKALWTLYTSFAYVLSLAILLLVTGWRNWDLYEYAGVVGSPILIYAVRTALTTYYTYRLSKTQAHIDDLNSQRDAAIDKLKAATKYDSTQQLLEKYGAAGSQSPKASPSPASTLTRRKSGRYSGPGAPQQMPARTGLPPPPTANIPRRAEPASPPAAPSTPVRNTPFVESLLQQQQPHSPPPPSTHLEPSASFAPNAYDTAPQYSTGAVSGGVAATAQPRWYDRILDVLLGDDETKPGSRVVLICRECRLVNGQAPPGVKRPEDVGGWRCMGCRAWNGPRGEVERALKGVERTRKEDVRESERAVEKASVKAEEEGIHSSGEDEDVFMADADRGTEAEERPDQEVDQEEEEEQLNPARSTRSKTRSTRKKA